MAEKIMYKKVARNGSISIPISVRRDMGIQSGDALEVTVTEDKMILQPYQIRCCFCGTLDGVRKYEGRGICEECIRKVLKEMGGNANG